MAKDSTSSIDWSSKDAKEKLSVFHLLTGTTDKGEDFFAFMRIPQEHYPEFLRRIATGEEMLVEEFGEVLHKGFAKNPTEPDWLLVKMKYNIDNEFWQKFAKELEKRFKKA